MQVFCTLCQEGLSLLGEQLALLEKLTDEDLGSLVDLLCTHAPRNVPIVDSLCVVLRDDLVAAITKLVQGLRAQLSPKQILLLVISAVLCSAQSDSPASNCKVFCNFCQEGFSLIQKNIALIESLTHDQLNGLLDKICEMSPKLDIIHLFCDVAKNDVLDGINKFLDFLKRSSDPVTTCHQLSIC
ncbi:unnamed protein product [Caenorhabditis brenneri]